MNLFFITTEGPYTSFSLLQDNDRRTQDFVLMDNDGRIFVLEDNKIIYKIIQDNGPVKNPIYYLPISKLHALLVAAIL